jgi:hypothetical protein
MKTLSLLVSILIIPIYVSGQTPQSVKMNNNKISSDAIKPELQYIFPDFQNGKIIMKNQTEVKCKLNYSFLHDEVLFINENGEKMALANPEDISEVHIANRTFIPGLKGYCEVIERGTIGLVYKWTCNISEKGKEGALGITTDAPSVVQMNRMSFDAKEWKLDVDKEAVVSVEVIPYLKIRSKYVSLKGAKDFFKAIPGKKDEIKTYIDQNPVDFKKELDLRRLTQYCNSL